MSLDEVCDSTLPFFERFFELTVAFVERWDAL